VSAGAPQEIARVVRRHAGLFRGLARGVIEVGGEDRVRWLNGMLTNDVTALAPGGRRGCPALLLTPKGGIVADVHVLLREATLWLDLEREALPGVLKRLQDHVIADDVTLAERSPALARLALEGPAAAAILAAAAGAAPDLAAGDARELPIDDMPVVVAAFGWSGERAFQLFVPALEEERLVARLRAAGAPHGLVEGDAAVLEVLRVEAGIPRLGRELGPDVLPPEAHLESAVSYTKGCYTGQEIVARLRSRGQVNHLLVGLSLAGAAPPAAGAEVLADQTSVGAVTSAALSPQRGPIALAFVRRAHAVPGTAVRVAGMAGRVEALPLVAPAAEGA
jgi:aminomethyltransferase